MRKIWTAIAGAIVAMALAQPAVAHERSPLRALCGGDVAVVRRDDRRAVRPAAGLLNADGTTSVQTSTTNIGAYMWSAVAAERLGIIGHRELVSRVRRTITTLEGMERHAATASSTTGTTTTPARSSRSGRRAATPLTPILSSVDNGWLAVGLKIVADRRAGGLAPRRGDLRLDGLRLLLPARRQPDPLPLRARHGRGGLLLRHVRQREPDRDVHRHRQGRDPARRPCYGTLRAFPETCDWPGGDRAVRADARYFGVPVYDGALPYNGTRVTPSWGGSMFEALMPSLFVPEERWAPGSWGVNHPLTVDAQIHHGLAEAGYGYWGFSPSNTPEGGYAAYGVDGIGSDPNGYPSDEDRTSIDHGCPDARPRPQARPAAQRVHERRRHAARRVPRPALPPARGGREPRAARERLRRSTRRGVPRLGERRHRRRVRLLPVARPGDDHGRARQRARARRAAAGVRDPRRRAGAAPGHRRRGVRLLAAAVHDHRHGGPGPAPRDPRRRRDLRPGRRRHDRGRRRRRRRVRRRGRRPGRRRRRRRHAVRRRGRGPARRRPRERCDVAR